MSLLRIGVYVCTAYELPCIFKPMETNWTTRIYAPSGFVRANILTEKKAVDIGCGDRKLPGAIGVDSLALPSVDVVHNLAQFPWPLESNNFDLVFANHFLEHADDVMQTLKEIHRILVPGGRAVLQVPYFRSVDAFSDPTHRHYFTASSLDYVIEGTKLAGYEYADFRFKKVGFWYGWPQRSKNPFAAILKSFMHTHTHFYDQRLSLLLPVECVTWELEKI